MKHHKVWFMKTTIGKNTFCILNKQLTSNILGLEGKHITNKTRVAVAIITYVMDALFPIKYGMKNVQSYGPHKLFEVQILFNRVFYF
jgi:hypothetical protein